MIITTKEEALLLFNQDCEVDENLKINTIKQIFDSIVISEDEEHDPQNFFNKIDGVSEHEILLTFFYLANTRLKILKMQPKYKTDSGQYEHVTLSGKEIENTTFLNPITNEPIPDNKVFLFFFNGNNLLNIKQNNNLKSL